MLWMISLSSGNADWVGIAAAATPAACQAASSNRAASVPASSKLPEKFQTMQNREGMRVHALP